MRSIIRVLTVFILGLSALYPLVAKDARAEDKTISTALSSMIKSSYVNGKGAVISEEPVLQSGATASFRNGFYVDLRHSAGLQSGPHESFADEIDLTAGWTGKLGEKGFSLDAGISHFNIFPLDTLGGLDMMQLYASVFLPGFEGAGHTLTPYVRTEVTRSADGDLADWEPVFSLGGRYRFAWKDWQLDNTVAAVYNSETLGLLPGVIGLYQGKLGWKLNETVTFHPLYLQQSIPISLEEGDGRKARRVWGLGVTLLLN